MILEISIEKGLDHEKGLDDYVVSKKKFNETTFMDYLDDIYIANKHTKIALFMDNASSHKTINVKMKLQELEIEPIHNIPYQPDLIRPNLASLKLRIITKEIRSNAIELRA